MPETNVVGGLKWVKGELVESLHRVRGRFEAFIAGGSETDCLEAIKSLNEVRGVLLALQMTAPARLTDEMQSLLERLASGRVADRGEAAEALMLALVQLPHYLEVASGRGDSPATLLPLINDLRASLGTRVLSAAELVVPYYVLAEREAPTPDVIKALATVAANVRPAFHRDLLLTFRGDGESALGRLGQMFHQLHRFSRQGVFSDAFRAAEAVTAGILATGAPVTPRAKAALGHIDGVFKPLLQPEPAWPETPARRLIEECLNVLADIGTDSSLVHELDAKYRPKADAEDGSHFSEEVSRRGALGAEAMASLTGEVLRQLSAAKDTFDLFVRGGGAAPEQLAPMEASLHQLANTMAIGEDTGLVSSLAELANDLGRLVRGERQGDDAFYLDFAQSILSLEETLGRGMSGDDGVPGGSDALLGALREARLDLGKARQAIADYAVNPGDLRRPRDAVEILPGVAAALHMVGQDGAAEVMDGVVAVLQQRFISGGYGPQPAELDLLAEAIAGVEMHLEGLAQGVPFGNDILARAQSAIDRLAAGAPQQLAVALADLAVAPAAGGGGGMDGRAPTGPEAPLHARERQRLASLGEPASEGAGATPEAALSPPEAGETVVGLDHEFLDIFLEEAREEQGRIGETLGLWLADHADQEALAVLRRSFHTLKGSGRLVGASRVAEVAAVTESVLNRVLAGEIDVGPSVLSYLTEVAECVPALIQAEADAVLIDIQPLIARGHGFLDRTPVAVPVVPVAEEVCAADPELLEIFVAEAREHLTSVTDFLAIASRDDTLGPTTDLLRALHTLCGSARMVGIESIASAGRALDRLCAAFRERDMAASGPLRDLLERGSGGIAERLDHLPDGGAEIAALALVAAEAAGWTATLVDTVPAAARSPEEGLETMSEAALAALEAGMLADLDLEGAAEPAPELTSGIEPSPEDAGTAPVLERFPALPGEAEALAAGLTEEPSAPTEIESYWIPEGALAEETPGESKAVAEGVEGLVTVQPESLGAEPPAQPEPEIATPIPTGLASAAQAPPDEAPADAALTALFLEDAHDLLDRIDERMRNWQLAPDERKPLESIQRLLHTLKGSARLSGLPAIGDLSHALESTLSAISRGDMVVSDDALELAQRSLDTLSVQVDAVEQGALVPAADDLVSALSRSQGAGAAAGAVPGPAGAAVPAPGPAVVPAAGTAKVVAGPPAAADTGKAKPGAAVAQIRVRADLLNRLVNNSGEISIYRARLAQQNGTLGFSLAELDQTVGRLREQLRQLDIETEAQILYRYDREAPELDPTLREFDPLELDRFSALQQRSRSITETVNDLISVKNLLAEIQRDSADLLVQQARIATDLQDGLLRTRMVPFVQVVPRLHRLVRQTAQTLEKRANLVVRGPEVELDRSILDRLGPPLEHLLRNAIAHGIESPERRRAADKPVEGVIDLVLSREGNDVVIVLSDDGGGMDLAAFRRRASERGLLQGGDVTDEELLQLAMEPGFSTAEKVTQISGRGVGLDVVATEVKRLSGTLTMTSRPGQGSAFTIRLPLTLAIIDALLVALGDVTYAIPHGSIDAVTRIPRAELEECYSGRIQDFTHLGQDYRIMHLGGLLDPGVAPDLGDRRWLPLLLVRTSDQRLALQVDSLIGTQRIVVKPLGSYLSGVRWLNGGTILPDGRVALILDLLTLARSPAVQAYRLSRAQAAIEEQQQACVMVVDDSLTVRRVTSRLLRRQNMDVITASDGVEALALLEDRIPDVILLDIEMPRMDGYELTRHIRRSPRLEAIPIIMITSRTGEKHRRTAMELGVNRYLGKPYQEAELLDEISSVLMEATA